MIEPDAIDLIRGERFVILLRHGIAEDRSDERPDRDRSLTREGQTRVKQISRALVRMVPKIDRLVSSPFVRCVQTAMFVAKAYDDRVKVETMKELGADHSGTAVVQLLAQAKELRVLIVGHEPNLSETCAMLTGMEAARLELKRGGFYGIRIDAQGPRLEWMVAPRVIRRLSD